MKPSPAQKALDLWWIGNGGALRSPCRSHYSGSNGEDESGVDYPFIVANHLDKGFFRLVGGEWRNFAKYAVSHGYEVSTWGYHRLSPGMFIRLGMGQLLVLNKAHRGDVALRQLLKLLSEWLDESPLPEPPVGWE